MARGKKNQPKLIYHDGLRPMCSDCAGLDVGSREMWVDVGIENDPQPVRKFDTFTEDLNAMARWLKSCGIRSLAMESTGVYWIPVFQILEAHGIEPVLVNAAHVKNVSGRKTDWLDCQWIRVLHCYGLLRGSFYPAPQIAVLRSYIRHRQSLVEAAASHIQHMQKALLLMNLQLHHVISDITGVTGMKILRAIVAGQRDPRKLAEMRDKRIKASEQTIVKALEGNYRPEHVFQLQQSLELFDCYQQKIDACHQHNDLHLQGMDSKADVVALPKARFEKKRVRNRPQFDVRQQAFRISGVDLTQIDSIQESAALSLLAEIGIDMSRWNTEKHFASWLALCPNNKITGGKVIARRTKKSAQRAREILCLCAQSLLDSRSALGAYCRRMCGRLGKASGITATAHKLALLVYRMIRFGKDYLDIGQELYEHQFKQRALKHLARKAKDLGFQLVPVTQNQVP
jgi:transposase